MDVGFCWNEVRHHLCVYIGVKWFEAAGELNYGGQLTHSQLQRVQGHFESNATVVLYRRCERRHPGRRFAWNATPGTSNRRAQYDFVEEVCEGGRWTPQGFRNPCRSALQVVFVFCFQFWLLFSFMCAYVGMGWIVGA